MKKVIFILPIYCYLSWKATRVLMLEGSSQFTLKGLKILLSYLMKISDMLKRYFLKLFVTVLGTEVFQFMSLL
jgi:hypothetical protein